MIPSTDSSSKPIDPLAQQSIEEIERIDQPSIEAFESRYRARRRPVVIKLREQPHTWSLEKLSEKFSELQVSAIRTEQGRMVGTAKNGTGFESIRFGDVLEPLLAGRRPAWHVSAPLTDFPEELRASAPLPPYCTSPAFVRSRVWLAPIGTVTPLHWDLPLNMIRPIFGRRRVLLYPPLDIRFVAPNMPFSKMPNFARFDPEKPDLERFPRARFARPVRTIVEPGELLFIPTGWWHHIRSIETSLVVNYWFGGQALALSWKAGQIYKWFRGLYRNEWASNK